MMGILPDLPTTQVPHDCPLHIYMVCRRPRITLDPDFFIADEEVILLKFKTQKDNNFEDLEVAIWNDTGKNVARFECPYPHTEFALFAEDDSVIASGKVAVFARNLVETSKKLNFDLEVLYVGQAYGSDGKRTAPDRLASHSTLQAIYADVIKYSPDHDVWLILWSFEPSLIISMSDIGGVLIDSEEKNQQHIMKMLVTEISEQQQINFTEAALIQYFHPDYNIRLKGKFPNPAHSTYSECYDLDLSSVTVELETSVLGLSLWSRKVQPDIMHIAQFDLHSAKDRRGMFDFWGKSEES